jgi:CheY-like chemotaxis protein
VQLVRSGLTAAVRQLLPDMVVIVLDRGDDRDWDRINALDRDAVTRHIPVIIVTSAVRPDGANRRKARGLGNCAAFVAKPCDHRMLIASAGLPSVSVISKKSIDWTFRMMNSTSELGHSPCMYCAFLSLFAAGYWNLLAPLVHSAGPRAALVGTLTALFVFAPGYLPGGPLTFNVVI